MKAWVPGVSGTPRTVDGLHFTQDGLRHTRQRNHFVSGIARDGLLRHAEDDRRRLVLNEGRGSRLFHLEKTIRTVVSHARQDDA